MKLLFSSEISAGEEKGGAGSERKEKGETVFLRAVPACAAKYLGGRSILKSSSLVICLALWIAVGETHSRFVSRMEILLMYTLRPVHAHASSANASLAWASGVTCVYTREHSHACVRIVIAIAMGCRFLFEVPSVYMRKTRMFCRYREIISA